MRSRTHIFPARTHALLRRVLLNVTGVPQTTLSHHAADNEHINMYIPSQVNACLALQFHGPVSGLRGFFRNPVSHGFSIRWRKKNIAELLNRYMTDSLADETQGEGNGKRKKEQKLVQWSRLMPKITLCEDLILKNIAQKIKQAPKLIAGCPSEVKSHLYNFHSDSQYLFDSWAHRFCLCRSIGTNCVLKWIKRKGWLSIEHRNIPRMINILWSAHFSKICKYLSAIMRQGTFPA